MTTLEHDRRGWILVSVLLIAGLLCVFFAGGLALRFPSSWRLASGMESNLDPNSEYLTLPANQMIQPLDPAILTQPVWIDVFLTPGITVPTRQLNPTSRATDIAPATNTVVSPVISVTAAPSFTPTFIPAFIPSKTSVPASTRVPDSTPTSVPPSNTTEPTLIPSVPPPAQSDLQITKSNGVLVYSAGSSLTYTVSITNNGPAPVAGALLSDAIGPQIANWSWACTSESNGASGCTPVDNSSGDFSDLVDLPNGASIVYTVTVLTRGDSAGSLVNTALATAPDGVTDPVPGNNSAIDMDDLLLTIPSGSIGMGNDYNTSVVPPGGSITLAFNTPLAVGGHPGWDLVMYEFPNGSGIAMDLLILQISDGSNWYTVFNWGDNVADTNSNLDISLFGGPERDNRNFTTPPESDALYPFNSGTEANPSTGIVFDLDGVVPAGTYPYIRIISPAGGDSDGGCEIDGFFILP
jgi:uncharacterized repeat protein (TIGR01451 family)